MVLETRFQNVSEIVIRQEEEITRLNSLCRALHRDLDKSVTAQNILFQQHQDLETETSELQEFMQAEKTTLTDALKEAEAEIHNLTSKLQEKDKIIEEKEEECNDCRKISEQKRYL